MTAHTLRSLVADRDPRELRDVCARWGRSAGSGPEADSDVAWLSARMSDLEIVRGRLANLPPPQADLLAHVAAAPAALRTKAELEPGIACPSHGASPSNGSASTPAANGTKPQSRLVGFGLEVALTALVREGFLWPARSRAWQDLDARGFAIPAELQGSIATLRAQDAWRLEERLSLQGWLTARYFRADRERGAALDEAERTRQADHARKIYKLYLLAQSIEGRIRALPAASRELFERVLVAHGGFLPLTDPAANGALALDVDLQRRALEEALLGTIVPLPLERVGVEGAETVVLFHEVVLHGLQAQSERSPVAVEETLSCGIDLSTNLSRFLRELEVGEVQFTSEGKLYKASEKRIAKGLIALPGSYLEAEAMTAWLYKLCVQRRLVDRRGARALGVTEAGRSFERLPLEKRLETMLAFAIEERDLPGEPFHQVRLRRYLLKLLRRARPEQWHELLFLPFLARAAYLPTLDAEPARAFFASRTAHGMLAPTETLQSLCWNLIAFVKKRLYPLGLVDLGLRDGRPVALRLSKLGAEVLGGAPPTQPAGERASLIVNPDFEILVFPGADLHDLLHTLDRFARRTKSDQVHHYQIAEETVRGGVAAGLSHAQIAQDLVDRARAPVPQNVLWSLAEWCRGAAS